MCVEERNVILDQDLHCYHQT